MRCPVCNHPEDRVIDSRPLESATVVRRRRICAYCGKRFTTYERIESTPLMVIKSDNRREPFNREKIREGLRRAFEKRPVSSDSVEKLISEIEYDLQDYVMEVTSREIGDRILKKLYHLDPVAYVRFASVYKQFAELDDFLEELKRVKKAYLREQQKGSKAGTRVPDPRPRRAMSHAGPLH
jgi:transcriptional repressor NrdR